MLITSSVSLRPVAHAQSGSISGGYTLLEPLPDLTSGGGGTKDNVQFSEYVDYAFKLFIALAAFASVFMIVWGGLQYMSTDAWEGKSAGISKLKNAVLGLLLVLCSYLILQTIDPRLVSIPSTLVPPLQGLDYTPQMNSFLSGIDSQIASLKVQNTQLTQDITNDQQQLTSLQNQNQGVLNDLGMTADEADYYCQSYPDDPSCLQLANIADQQNTVQGDMSLKTGMALMNDVVMQCQAMAGNTSAGTSDSISNSDYCNTKIRNYRDQQVAQLNALGQTAAANQLMNYAGYSAAMQDINAVVTQNMSSSPYYAAIKDTVQKGLYVVGTAAGGAAGAAVIGFGGGVIVNATASAIDVSAARTTATQVEAIIQRNLQTTTDPTTVANLKAQEHNIIKSLGATPLY